MPRDPDRPTILTVEDVIDETPTVRTITITDRVMSGALPGQFAMVWVPGVGELPMSIMIHDDPDRAAFTVRRHGVASTGLYNVDVGGKIGVRGPYGNSFDVRNGRLLLVGGGTGLVPLMRLLGRTVPGDDVTILIGARRREEVFFEDLAKRILQDRSHSVIVTTDDGSYGRRGLVTDEAEKLCREIAFNGVYTCGPEIMMYRTVQIARQNGFFVQASLERMMKCGVGICGSCCMGRDLICHDGPVFDGGHLASNPEFGRIFRNKAGVPEEYP